MIIRPETGNRRLENENWMLDIGFRIQDAGNKF
jgi:hypothetical protein